MILARNVMLYTALLTSACASQSSKSVIIDEIATKHAFDAKALATLFDRVKRNDDVLKKIAAPAEAMPWHKYRKIFLTDARVEQGVAFWRKHKATLEKAAEQYGVPPEIVVAILGVETLYGQHTGTYRIIDALSTLAFGYPPRSRFFSSELEQYLLMCREEKVDPLIPTGSYAGAMGLPQFMPSSFRAYAVDYNDDGKRDLWHTPEDAIASIANYFKAHGWIENQPIAAPVSAKNSDYKTLLNDNIKPNLRINALESAGIEFTRPLPEGSEVKLLALSQEHGDELWAVLNNFYVITRYNHSPLYAMAVYQLSQALLNYQYPAPYE